MIATNFCIAGFPKCGTTALAEFFARSPAFHLAAQRGRGSYEAPFFHETCDHPDPPYVPGRVNGHKSSMYVRSLTSMRRILDGSPDCLFLFCVREAGSALVSWHRMHQMMARSDRSAWHFTHRTPETRAFFSGCTLDEYFREYAGSLLDYADALARFQRNLPRARFAVVSQKRLAADARGVMKRLHRELGQEPTAEYLNALPTSHRTQAEASLETSSLSKTHLAALHELNQRLVHWLAALPPGQNLTLGETEFALSAENFAPGAPFIPPDDAHLRLSALPSIRESPAMDASLLEVLCCPETRQPLRFATTDELARLAPAPEAALVREDGHVAYPIRDRIPLLVVEEQLPLTA